MTRYLRYFRIAFSAFCGIACVLLIALWVRSYTWRDRVEGSLFNLPSLHITILSMEAQFRIICIDDDTPFSWRWLSTTIDDWSNLPIRLNDPTPKFFRAGFGIGTDPFSGGSFVLVRYWLSLLASTTLAVAPWIRWRFSLRTLLIATTLIAVVLGLAVWALR